MGWNKKLEPILKFNNFHFSEYRIDVQIGGLFPNLSKNVRLLTAYYSDDITWCIPRAKPVHTWQHILFIFPEWFWLSLVPSFYISSLLIYILFINEVMRHDFHIICLNVLAMVLCQAWILRPKTTIVRFFCSFVLIFGIFFIAIFNCFYLSHVTRHTYNVQINKLAQMQANNFQLLGSRDILEMYQQMNVVVVLMHDFNCYNDIVFFFCRV